MKYVSAFPLSFLVAITVLSVPAPSFADAAAPADLNNFTLSDDEIADRCAASIQAKLDMVDLEDETTGIVEKVPRCVSHYVTMRKISNGYLQKQEGAVKEISSSLSSTCDTNATQSGCLKAGEQLVETAAILHESLSTQAAEAEVQLAKIDQ